MEEINISKITYDFVQEGNTQGTTDEYEKLTIEVETVLGDINEGNFYVLRTEGWSINSILELEDLFKKIKQGFPLKE